MLNYWRVSFFSGEHVLAFSNFEKLSFKVVFWWPGIDIWGWYLTRGELVQTLLEINQLEPNKEDLLSWMFSVAFTSRPQNPAFPVSGTWKWTWILLLFSLSDQHGQSKCHYREQYVLPFSIWTLVSTSLLQALDKARSRVRQTFSPLTARWALQRILPYPCKGHYIAVTLMPETNPFRLLKRQLKTQLKQKYYGRYEKVVCFCHFLIWNMNSFNFFLFPDNDSYACFCHFLIWNVNSFTFFFSFLTKNCAHLMHRLLTKFGEFLPRKNE